jgi:predicted unusual protein kinase regulating ubiquinone biosynthesis (AarF/ABC1/UbiB family)
VHYATLLPPSAGAGNEGADGAAPAPAPQPVAVKVQHSGLRELVEVDLLTLRLLTRVGAWAFKDFQFEWICPEFETNLRRELQFLNEAKNAEATANNFRNNPNVYIPKVCAFCRSALCPARRSSQPSPCAECFGCVGYCGACGWC